MKIEINGKVYDVEIIKKNNKNTYVRVRNGKIIVTTHYLTGKNSILKLIKDNEKGIIKMIDMDNKKVEKNEDFYYFGKKYDIVYGFDDIDIIDDKIYVKDSKTLDKFITHNIVEMASDRVMFWYAQFDEHIPFPHVKLRKMTSRWGVCNIKTNTVTLNYYLYKYDISCLDYVIVHELSHFIHPNHSFDFWNLVGKYYPKYKNARKMLKE